MTPAPSWFLVLAAMGAALTGYALDVWRLDLLALGVVWALGSLAVWLDGPAPEWVVRVDAALRRALRGKEPGRLAALRAMVGARRGPP